MDPEVDISALVASITSRTAGTNLFRGPRLAIGTGVPADCIFVEAHPGDRPQALIGNAQNVWSADVEVTVRGVAGKREAARELARQVLRGMQQATRGGLPGYSSSLVVDGEPEALPPEANLCPLYSFAVNLMWVE